MSHSNIAVHLSDLDWGGGGGGGGGAGGNMAVENPMYSQL